MLRRDGQPVRIGWRAGNQGTWSALPLREPGAWKGCLQAGTGKSQDIPRVVLDLVKCCLVPLFLNAFGALLFLQQKGVFFCGVPVSLAADPNRRGTGRYIDSLSRFPMMGHGLRELVEGADFSARSMSARLFASAVPSGRPAWLVALRGLGEGLLVRRSPVSEAA